MQQVSHSIPLASKIQAMDFSWTEHMHLTSFKKTRPLKLDHLEKIHVFVRVTETGCTDDVLNAAVIVISGHLHKVYLQRRGVRLWSTVHIFSWHFQGDVKTVRCHE